MTNTVTIDEAMHLAIAHQQAGRYQEAERIYQAVLQTQPRHSDANHNMGALAKQVGRPALGLPLQDCSRKARR